MPDESKQLGVRSGRMSQASASQTTAETGDEAETRARGGEQPATVIDSAVAADVPVIGIGASAGGIEALGRLFDVMPADSRCAFVVVLHLDPKRESEMAHILGGRTRMAVVQVKDGMRIAPDHVYVIAPDTDLEVRDGGLHVSPPAEPHGQRHPVDLLFSSLAADQREGAIAIVLSGTGSNGTEGLKKIRAVGGMSLVQAPETAKFDGMPRSAISAGMADHVLAPEDMPARVAAYVQHGYVAAPAEIKAASPGGQATLDQVLEILRVRGGHDFRSYKHSTITRRIHRRLGLRNIETLDEYLDELRTSPDEVTTLVGDLMISVTEFFRDAPAWAALSELVIAPMVADRETGATIRVWAPACSTGEEPYSIAMLMTELAEAAGKRFDVKVFATDTQEGNLRKARDGIYPAAAVAGFPPARLQRFFEKLDGSFQVTKELRDMIVFAPQNLLRDPPFSRLDLVSCRNLLIYLEPEAQRRIIALCHFALRQGGHLFLGNAETIGRHDDLFETVSKKWRIYRKLGQTRHGIVDFPPPRGPAESRGTAEPASLRPEATAPAAEIARRALLELYAPASVLIDQKHRVLYFHGTTRDYLEHPPGDPTRDLLTLARGGLSAKLRVAIRAASKGNRRVAVDARITETGDSVTMTVMPLPTSPQDDRFLLVSFAPTVPSPERVQAATPEEAGEAASGERALQDELRATRAELQMAIEHLETTNEELKSSNEEITSINEELQSTNEELETSKEELQSFNEELNTVNSQLQHKIGELENATNDLNNLLAGSETATLFLDLDFRIKWFAPATRDLFDFVWSDVGRPIAHFARKFSDENLLRDADTVTKKLSVVEAEVSADDGRWYLRRMLPYRTQDNRIAGLVMTFTDITDRRRAADAVNEARIYAESIVQTIRQPLLILDGALRVRSANPAFYELFKVSREETQGRQIYQLCGAQWDTAELRTLMDNVISKDEEFTGFEIEQDFHDSGRRSILLNARKLAREGGREELILLGIEDITERKRSEELGRRLSAIVASSDDAIISKDLAGTVTSWNWGAEQLFGYTAEEIVGKSITIVIPSDRHDEEAGILDRIGRGEHLQHYETIRCRKDGSPVWVSLTISPLRDARGEVVGASKIARDMTERRRAEEHREILVGELNHRVKNVMATVQAVAAQTLSSATSVDDARASFEARLIALGKAHDLLTRENWAGADLRDIVAGTVEPHSGGSNRFRIEGPPLRLLPGAALSIAMALHELATNAAKYGALSTEEGKVDIVWEVAGPGKDRALSLRWTESGGPHVAEPTHKGFGSRLIQRVLAAELSGNVSVSYQPTGVVCTIDAPMPEEQEGPNGAD
ncbi:PAS domain S-box protein [Paracoccus sp. S-4012]|uniref:chemotaxis protein CheB n=1 Tax=Paracoccus sp. S-4012 TaxID=2665648 RepID=UPI0012B0772D|nr:chemotaxis protein CheB [Paracoccus sp. S-4012]MRX52303.1 PAS domain S-box protein [Paracoccus sp. S-4012]